MTQRRRPKGPQSSATVQYRCSGSAGSGFSPTRPTLAAAGNLRAGIDRPYAPPARRSATPPGRARPARGRAGGALPGRPRLVRLLDQGEFDALATDPSHLAGAQFLARSGPFSGYDYPFTFETRFRRPASHHNLKASNPKLSAGGYPLPSRRGTLSSVRVSATAGRGIKKSELLAALRLAVGRRRPVAPARAGGHRRRGGGADLRRQRWLARVTWFANDYTDQIAYAPSLGFGGDGIADYVDVDGSGASGPELEAGLCAVAAGQPTVRALHALGSRQDGEAHPDADLDLGVLYTARQHPETTLRLEEILDRVSPHRVDLIDVSRACSFLALAVVRGDRLFTRDPLETDRFELYVLRRAGDLLPFERERRAVLLSPQR